MKIRIGMTIPLGIENTNRVALRLPSFVERNFRMTPSFKHEMLKTVEGSVQWAESIRCEIEFVRHLAR